jgi:hypothetical protein
MHCRQFYLKQRSVPNGPFAVLGEHKNRDGPLIYHLRDGPFFVTGPPREADPSGGSGPPGGVGPPEEIRPLNEIRPPGWTGPQHETGPPNGHGPPHKKKQTGVEFESTKVTEKQNINLIREETKMKNFKLKRLLSLACVGLLSALQMPTVFAAAGDTIGNTATLTFDVGGTPTVLESSLAGNTLTGPGNGTPTDFTEDRLINFDVATQDVASIPVAPSATLRVQTFTVTNNGNGTQDFLLTAINNTTGGADPFPPGNADNFNPTTTSVFVETANPGAYVVGDDTDIFIDELAAGASIDVYIVSTIPGAPPVSNGDIAVLSLVAQVADNTGGGGTEGTAITNDDNGNTSPAGTYSNGTTVVAAGVANDVADIITGVGSEQIVFNDPAGATAVDVDSAGAAQDVVQNGQHSDSSSYTVGAAELTVQKTSAVLWDPINGNSNPKAIPGAYVQYTITVSNAGTAGADGDLTTLSDTLTLTDLDPNLILATATTPVPGVVVGVDIENAVGDGIRIDTSGTARAVPAAGTFYCTGGADADGCDYVGGVGGTLTVTFTTIAAMIAEDVAPVGAGPEDYAAGALKPGESVVIVFNAIVQ